MSRFNIKNSEGCPSIPAIFSRPTAGDRNEAFLLLHGLSTSKHEYLNFYDTLSEALLQRGFSVLRIDFRAHGDSLSPTNEFHVNSAVGDAARALEWILSETGLDTIKVFGTSFGGSISVLLASLFPRLVSDLYLLAPVLDYKRLYIEPENEARKSKYHDLVREAILKGKPRQVGEKISFGQTMVINLATISIPDHLQRLTCSITIMHGDQDGAVPLNMSRDAADALQNVSLHEFPGMEHGFTELGDESGDRPASIQNLSRIIELASS